MNTMVTIQELQRTGMNPMEFLEASKSKSSAITGMAFIKLILMF